MMTQNKTLICIVGPTASGKTLFAIQLAQSLNTEIISADSRQFYRELSIGTAKPSPQELAAVAHHFINNKSIQDTYSAGDFEKEALRKIDELFKKHDTLIMVGGSGMYIDAVCNGFDPLPEVAHSIREDVINKYESLGIGFLQEELKRLDPKYYESSDIQNPQRIMRALEVIYSTGKPFSDFRQKKAKQRDFRVKTYGLNWERNELYARINARVDLMIKDGLEQEAKINAPFKDNYALCTVGYNEFFDYFDGKQDLKTTVSLIKQHTRNFAKRQLTWFRRNAETIWLDAKNENAIFAVLNKLKE